MFDGSYRKVVARGEEPLIAPSELAKGATDIAFSASALEQESRIWLYYSVSDMSLHRATLITERSSTH
jgi:hypothetical protein